MKATQSPSTMTAEEIIQELVNNGILKLNQVLPMTRKELIKIVKKVRKSKENI